jgi:peptidoglycan/LPS O-acetylase OafA/YrhL
MSHLPPWVPAPLRQITVLQLAWALAVSLWVSLIAAWQWPLFSVGGAGATTALFFPVYLAVCALVIAAYYRLKGAVPERTVESKNIERIPRLDHLRFYAAALVVLYHYYSTTYPHAARGHNFFLNVINEGSSGVDIFFVLSGFIFGAISCGKRIRYFEFLWSRVVRIYPLYLFSILLVLAVHPEKFLPVDSVMLLLPCFIISYLPALPGFGQLWTIGLEFQFYLLFPFLAMFILRNGHRYLIGVLLLAIGLRTLYYPELGTVKNIGYGTLLGRIDQFVIGMGAAWIYLRHRSLLSHPGHLVAAVILAIGSCQWLIAWDSLGTGAGSPLWIIWPTAEGAIWGYLTLSYVSCRMTLPALLDQGLAQLGALSFSIYVMHNFAVAWTQKYAATLSLTGQPDVDGVLQDVFICVPLSVIIAWFTYNLVEKQFFIYRRKYVEPAAAPAAAVVS